MSTIFVVKGLSTEEVEQRQRMPIRHSRCCWKSQTHRGRQRGPPIIQNRSVVAFRPKEFSVATGKGRQGS